MNSLVKVFSNFKEFYNEINGATLTGAIDVIVVEQPNGDFKCSPFHVRFGKLGVLRSREKVVDIEINGEPVDIHMKLGDSGEAFFVEEITEEDIESLPDNLATSPIPSSYFPASLERDNSIEDKSKIASDDIQLPIVLPRRNSIDLSKETDKAEVGLKIENQVSDYSHRRHTDNTLNRSNLRQTVKEYTTQKIRQEWAEQHEEIFQFDAIDKEKDWANSTHSEEPQAKAPAAEINNTTLVAAEVPSSLTVEKAAKASNTETAACSNNLSPDNSPRVEESKSKKKRRKKTQMKKKNAQRKSSSSSSIGSNNVEVVAESREAPPSGAFNDDVDNISLSNKSVSMSLEDGTKSAPLLSARNGDESPGAEGNSTNWQGSPVTPVSRIPLDLDIHFFSDTEVTSPGGIGPGNGVRSIAGRPSTPIQSDSELEISLREKESDMELMKNTASWKWGELPTAKDLAAGESAHEQAQAQRNSMLSGMFNFMKKTNKIRKQANEEGVYLSDLVGEGMNQDLAAMYLPQEALLKEEAKEKEKLDATAGAAEDDRESGNGTSLPQSPSSMEGQKSTDSDYDDGGKPRDEKYLDFVAMSLSGMDEEGEVSPEEFDRYLIKYNDVCQNPSLFTSPNLVVRLNGKYYSWAAACPIVMSIITFQKPLSNDVIEQLMSNAKPMRASGGNTSTTEVDGTPNTSGGPPASVVPGKRSWWYWRRSQNGTQDSNMPAMAAANKGDDKDVDHLAVGTQTTRPNSPDVSDNTLSKTDSTLNAENTSAMVDNMEDLSQASSKNSLANGTGNSNGDSHKSERYKKTLRLSSEAIKKLNLKMGMNEIEFSVTTAYQGTTRCKCFLFRWKHNDKVVISDIDGTITRSDVLGHILPMVGKDWAQLGVAELFSKIEMNGYKLLYLSARAIGQARATREYLRSIRQGDVSLPDGPLLLNPTSLISAFHREVIERKPEQFKIACLSDIKELFPVEEPFYAGYGNRINDVWAYRAVGIPIMRIFTINTKGELKHELTQTFQSSGYINQSLEVDEYFPALDEYDFQTDPALDDGDDLEDELIFSDSLDDDGDSDSGEDLFSDDYADDVLNVTSVEAATLGVKNDMLRYSRMTSIADQLFPPIEAEALDTMYSNFNYWRNPIPTLEIELDVSQEIANTTRNSTLNASLSKPLSTIPEN